MDLWNQSQVETKKKRPAALSAVEATHVFTMGAGKKTKVQTPLFKITNQSAGGITYLIVRNGKPTKLFLFFIFF